MPDSDRAVPAAELLASAPERLLAFFIDSVVVIVPLGLIGVAFVPEWASPGAQAAYGVLTIAAFFTYHGVLNANPGQTVGKYVLGIRALRLTGSGAERLGFGRSMLRSYGYFASALPFGLGYPWALVDRDRRALHDHLAGTAVFRFAKPTPGRRLIVGACAAFLVIGLGANTLRRVAARPAADIEAVEAARGSLAVLAALEEKHKTARGRCTDRLDLVLRQAAAPEDLRAALPSVFAENSLRIDLTPRGCVISARARDYWRTPLQVAIPR